MEVAIQSPPALIDCHRPAPFLSAPSSPRSLGDLFISAPTSPARKSEIFHHFQSRLQELSLQPSTVAFDWEEMPETPKLPKFEEDFAFNINGNLELDAVSADELFDGGKIRPLKPPPRLQLGQTDESEPQIKISSPRSPIHHGRRSIMNVFSPKKKKDPDTFTEEVENAINKERGREMGSARSNRRSTRSLSPCTLSARLSEEKFTAKMNNAVPPHHPSPVRDSSKSSTSSFSSSSSKRHWKLRLKELLLFRSASEGDKDSLKYTSLFQQNVGGTLRPASASRKKGLISAHELHYTANRAVSENMKKKTFLPYKKNIFGFGGLARR